MGGGVPQRLAAAVAAAWADSKDIPPALHVALFGCVTSALRQWLGDRTIDLELQVIDPEQRPSLQRTAPTQVRAELPVAWISNVWGRDFAIVAGQFCLEATAAGPAEWDLTTVDRELTRTQTLGPSFG